MCQWLGLVASATAAIAPATPAAAFATATTAAAAESATAGRTIFAGTGFVDGQLATAHLFAVQLFNGRFHASLIGHGDKAKTAGASGITIHDNRDFRHAAMLFEEFANVRFGCIKREVSYIQFCIHVYW